jgi:hypothetical protein
MRGFSKKTGGAADWPKKDESGLFLAKIAQIYRNSLAVPYVPAFSTAVNRLLHTLQVEEILLYSLFEGDLSHIREIALQAQKQRIRLKPRTVPGQDAATIVSIKKAIGRETVEVIP